MPPTTHNKSRSGSCKSGSSAHKASRKKRLDKENAELKRKLAQYEAAEEARKTAKRPTKEPLTAKKPLKDPKIPSNLGPERNTLTRKTQN
jgi:hypothetical protein